MVSQPALNRSSPGRALSRLAPRSALLAALGLGALALGVYRPEMPFAPYLPAAGGGVLALAFLASLHALLSRRRRKSRLRDAASLVHDDMCPAFIADGEGRVLHFNRAAGARFGNAPGPETMVAALDNLFASPVATLRRLQARAEARGFAREDIVIRKGHARLSAHRLGEDGFLWRLEEFAERSPAMRGAEGIGLPMMTASRRGTILFMNEAARRLLGGRQSHLDRVFNQLPLRPGHVHEVAGAEGPIRAQVCEIESAGRREIYLVPLGQEPARTVGGEDLFDLIPVPLMKVDPGGKIRKCNRLARELLARPDAEGLHMGELVEGLGRPVADWLAEAAGTAVPPKPEFVRATHQPRDVYLQISLERILEGGETLLLAALSDATKLKTLEAQFVQSQKMQAIGQLAGGVAHDFNNLLTAISGHCDLLLLRHDEGDPDYADLVQIHQNANRAASLVGQLLAFSRKQTLKPEAIEFRETLDDLAHLLNRLVGEKISLSLQHDPDLKPIRADKRQLEQVIMNLVVNARDAMPEGGEVRITTRMERLSAPLERDRATIPAGEYVVVTVRDEGVGIAPDRLQKVFEPFYTTKRTGEGTGLGLSMAYGIVKQTGGFIFVDSVPGSGTEFTLYFPAHDKPAALPDARPTEEGRATHARQGEVVLLVEDEAPVRAFAARALKMKGYKVLEAESAEEALAILDDEDLSVDVFVTDVVMPGMDGPSWVSRALEKRPGGRVIFVSGYAEDSFPDQQARIPNSVFLPKPFSLNELAATVQQAVH